MLSTRNSLHKLLGVVGLLIALLAGSYWMSRSHPSSSPAPIASPEGTGLSVPTGSAAVRERLTLPTETTFDVTFDLTVAPTSSGHTMTLASVRDAKVGGKTTSPDNLFAAELAPIRLTFLLKQTVLVIDASGQLFGTDSTAAVNARCQAPGPPGVSLEAYSAVQEAVQEACRLATSVPIVEASLAHAADLWIPWVGLWKAAGKLPQQGESKVVQAFGLQFAVQTLAEANGTISLEAKTVRSAITESDLFGGRSWFIPSSEKLPHSEGDTTFELIVRADIEIAASRPRYVTFTATERSSATQRKWAYEYTFNWR